MQAIWIVGLLALGVEPGTVADPAPGAMPVVGAPTHGLWRFEGEMGRRVNANVEQWLLRAPAANPGIIEMFHQRDRALPYGPIMPFAGEFAGKYLISAIQALDLTDDPRLQALLEHYVAALIDSQAEDGYLGPFREAERLLANWDLWGHYHCMLGLLMWYDRTGDERALTCVLRAADLMCALYIDTEHRPVQAGAPETNNLAVLHVLANLYRRTGNERYLRLVRVIEEDMTTVGDWLRQGDAGTPFHLLNGQGSRWESLHIVQGLAEMYRTTGDERYKKAVLSLWDSVRRFDRHPSGAFTTWERGVGSVYAQGQIETCCSVAWTALTVDVLELTGDARAADELELTLWNEFLAAQHPSGSWFTYDTPMNGIRYPTYQQISFQARPSAPELNCCSVNGPRGLGMLPSWAVMETATHREHPGLVVNFYGPGRCEIQRANGNRVALAQETQYPVEGTIKLIVSPKRKEAFPLLLRIPDWSAQTRVSVNGDPWREAAAPGSYLTIERRWKKGDTLEVTFDMRPRIWSGTGVRSGCVAIHAGPLLLAYDTRDNTTEMAQLPAFDMAAFALDPPTMPGEHWSGACTPMGLWKTHTGDGTEVVLTDFASAGALGTEYAAWLPATHAGPPPVVLESPMDGAVFGPGPLAFEWAYYGAPQGYRHELVVAKDAALTDVVLHETIPTASFLMVRDTFTKTGRYYWTVRTVNEYGTNTDADGPWSFTIDATHSPFAKYIEPQPDGPLVATPLDGSGTATAGLFPREGGSFRPTEDRTGAPGKAIDFWWWWSLATMRFQIPAFPERDYSMVVWLRPTVDGPAPPGALWVVSSSCELHDDPLRLVLEGDSLTAQLATDGTTYSTPAAPIERGAWTHVAIVKDGSAFTLYLNGRAVQTVAVPETLHSASTAIGLSSNPGMSSHGQRYVGAMDNFAFYGRALSAEEVFAVAK